MPKVRFYLNTSLAVYAQKPIKPLMFDGILGYAWAIKNGYYKNPSELNPSNLVFPDLPLEKVGDKCYAASAAFLPDEAFMKPTLIMRSPDWKNAMARRGTKEMRYDVSVGWQQACQEPYWEICTPYVDFYFQGDKKLIAELLSVIYKIRFLGSKRAAGYGFIRKIDLVEKTEDWSIWRNGQPTRPLPVHVVGEMPGLKAEWETYYPPYWASVNGAWCYTPPPSQWLPARTASGITETLEQYFAKKNEDLAKTKEKAESKSA